MAAGCDPMEDGFSHANVERMYRDRIRDLERQLADKDFVMSNEAWAKAHHAMSERIVELERQLTEAREGLGSALVGLLNCEGSDPMSEKSRQSALADVRAALPAPTEQE
jgi:hypothetical protein